MYYVYELIVIPDGNVCYVGKGSGKRMFVHRRVLNSHRYSSLGLYRRLRELITSNKDFKPRKVFETDNEAEALAEETRRINLYGLDNLFNSTNIPGPIESNWHEARCQAISKALKEYANRCRQLYGKGLPPETTKKIADATRGRKRPESGPRISAGKKGIPLTLKHRQALTGLNRKWTDDGLQRRKQASSLIMTKLWEDKFRDRPNPLLGRPCSDEVKRKMSKARKGCRISEAVKRKISATLTGRKCTMSEEARREKGRKISLAKTGKPYHRSVEATRKATISNTRKKRSEEARLRMSQARRRRSLMLAPASAAHLSALSEAQPLARPQSQQSQR